MANMHALATDGNEVMIVMHFPVPGTANALGVSWQSIVARYYGTTVLPDGDGLLGTISAAEKAQIAAGSVVEVVAPFKLGTSNPSSAQLDAEYAAQQARWQTEMQTRFARYGFTR